MPENDPEIYGAGFERVLGTCATWVRGISRHQIREVTFEALIAGHDFRFFVTVMSDGVVRAVVRDEEGRIAFAGNEDDWKAAFA